MFEQCSARPRQCGVGVHGVCFSSCRLPRPEDGQRIGLYSVVWRSVCMLLKACLKTGSRPEPQTPTPGQPPRATCVCGFGERFAAQKSFLSTKVVHARPHGTTTPRTYARHTSAHTQISRGLATGGTMSTVGPASGGGVAEIIGGLSCDLAAR